MAYRYGNRRQLSLLPASIEDYVAPDDPVRAYDVFIDTLDFDALGIELEPNKVGNSTYDPKTMLKLLVYGYSYGIRSSRKLERALHHNLSFIWLVGGLQPDHKTISEFRRNHKDALRQVLRQCARLCIELGIVSGNILFVDGTKIRANAGKCKNHTKEYYKKKLKEIDARIDELLDECDNVDESESCSDSLVKLDEKLLEQRSLRDKVKDALSHFHNKGNGGTVNRTVNITDPESALMKGSQGSHASYNVQSVVDDDNGLIVHIDSIRDNIDFKQFEHQITQAEENIGKQSDFACGDAGYSSIEELSKIEDRGTKVIVPSQRQALRKGEKPFAKSAFTYNKEDNCYYCPEGHKLNYYGKMSDKTKLIYKITDPSICKDCKHYGVCTKAKNGRSVMRLSKEELREKLEERYDSADGKKIYSRRKMKAEHPFGHIKNNLGLRNFLLKGRLGTLAEISIGATCFNIARMITIFGGVKEMIGVLQTV